MGIKTGIASLVLAMCCLMLLPGLSSGEDFWDARLRLLMETSPQPSGNSLKGILKCGQGLDRREVLYGEGGLLQSYWTVNQNWSIVAATRRITTAIPMMSMDIDTEVNRIVAVGWDGKVYYSYDCGLTMYDSGTVLTGNAFITRWNQQFLSGGQGGMRTSSDGMSWTQPVSLPGISTPIKGMAVSGAYGLAYGGSGQSSLSLDYGVTWTPVPAATPQNLNGAVITVTTTINTVVAVGGGGTILKGSTMVPGKTGQAIGAAAASPSWTSIDSGLFSDLNDVAFGRNLFVAVGGVGVIVTSPDGSAWTKRTSPTANNLNAVTFDEVSGTFTAVGDGGAWITSADGIHWSSLLHGTSNTLWGIAYGNNTFVSVGASGTVLTSPFGDEWTQRTSGTTDFLNGVTFGGNTFVAVGGVGYPPAGTVLTSPDGLTWKKQASKASNVLADVAYGNNTFVAAGMGGVVVTSPDGTNWTARNAGIPKDQYGNASKITGVAFGNNLFVAVTETAGIYTSPDGISWTPRPINSRFFYYGITFGGGQFVAVGGNENLNGVILTSADGINWTPQAAGTSGLLVGAAYGEGIFMAVGQNGMAVTSSDGVNWTARASASKNYLYRVAYGATNFVAVGYLGSIVRTEGCYASFSSYDFSLHLPFIPIGNKAYWADLLYSSGMDFVLSAAGEVDPSAYGQCAPAAFSSTGALHLPSLSVLGQMYQADFQYMGGVTFSLAGVTPQ